MKKMSKPMALLFVLAVYIAAFIAGMLSLAVLPFAPLWRFLCADAIATVFVWACGLLFRNASLYDPYWSVAPLTLFICFILKAHTFDGTDILYIAVFAFWGIRLTLNWIINWPGMHHQDWRYTMLHDQNSALWPLTNFFGINMMPTLIVYINMLPAFYCSQTADRLSLITVAGSVVCILAAVLQIISDGQMRRFRLSSLNKGRIMDTGLWRYSRHPNYLGEVSFWWGIYIMMLGQRPVMWWLIFAPILMTLMFVFISVPMMEKRLLSSRPEYAAYRKATSMLLLLLPREIKDYKRQADDIPY